MKGYASISKLMMSFFILQIWILTSYSQSQTIFTNSQALTNGKKLNFIQQWIGYLFISKLSGNELSNAIFVSAEKIDFNSKGTSRSCCPCGWHGIVCIIGPCCSSGGKNGLSGRSIGMVVNCHKDYVNAKTKIDFNMLLALMIFLFWQSGKEISTRVNENGKTVDINLNIDLNRLNVEENNSGML